MVNFKYSLGLRFVIIALLSLILLIPALMIQILIKDRKNYRDEAISEINDKWGNKQIVSGPILNVPFRAHYTEDEGAAKSKIEHMHILPEEITINGDIVPEIRYRGIYETVVYNTSLQISGTFSLSDIQPLQNNEIITQNATITVGITDMRGIRKMITLKWNDQVLVASAGIEVNDILSSGVTFKDGLSSGTQKYRFSTELHLYGSDGLFFTPVGKETIVTISSNWSNPSFAGNYLPEMRNVTPNGFQAKWKVLHFNRNFPQTWIGEQYRLEDSYFGVNLRLPVDQYQKTMRTSKYAIMFISLTFLSFFMIELLSRNFIHPVQYLLVGFALLVFYTLLLSLTEHMAFQNAYFAASAGIITLIVGYSWNIFTCKRLCLVIASILIVLYGYLYIVLQIQSYALLMGSIGLFAILAIIMYLTRHIDWFSIISLKNNCE